MKKLPLAITTFADIRDKEQDYLYVDKTEIAQQLIDRGKYYFLSRPVPDALENHYSLIP